MYVEHWEARLEMLAEWEVLGSVGPAGGNIEGALDGVGRCPRKERTEQREVWTFGVDFEVVAAIQGVYTIKNIGDVSPFFIVVVRKRSWETMACW